MDPSGPLWLRDGPILLKIRYNKVLLAGKRIGGLFYFNATTERGVSKTNQTASAFFGLKPGKITASGQDSARKLFEAHCSYGHMHMDKLPTPHAWPQEGHQPDV
jgi:hypothetical protein